MLDAASFLTRVLPETDGYISVHHLDHQAKPPTNFGGNAIKGLDTKAILGYANWANKKGWSSYFALGAQAKAAMREVSNGRSQPSMKPIRTAINVVAMKALWIDMDVKDGANQSLPGVLHAITDFCRATAIPRPNIAVGTGNGVHFYWTTKTAMEPTVWRVLAESLKQAAVNHGLLFDAECTTDAARVLRVPGTMNWKDPANPKPVQVLGALPDDYDVEDLQAALSPFYIPIQPAPVIPDGFGDMTAGIRTEARPVSMGDVIMECEVLRSTAMEGGANDQEPAWYRAIMAATYADEGRVWAHTFSSKHPDYDVEKVEAKYDQALKAREERDLGWPRCSQFASGPKGEMCKRCPHFSEGKSPLNFRPATAPQAGPSPMAPPANDLPFPYQRHATLGTIHVPMLKKNGSDDEPNDIVNVPVIDYPLYEPELILVDGKRHLRFVAHVPRGDMQKPKIEHGTVALDKITDKRACTAALSGCGIMVSGVYQDRVKEFLVSWTKMLQQSTVMTVRPAFGWTVKDADGTIEGFAYNGACHTPQGPLPVTEPSVALKTGYSPKGTLDGWKIAADALTEQKRPQIDAILAAPFAAPLTEFATNCPGLVMSVVSPGSGTGKTSAMRTAQAVWGNPRTEMNALDDTSASVAQKIGSLRSLPLLWDELRGKEDTLRFAQLIFQVTQGKEKSRLSGNLERRPVGTWETMLIAAANASVLERVADASPEGPAGVYRVLELEVPPIAKGQKDRFVAFGSRIDKVNQNYGHAGAVYAKYLGENAELVRQRVVDTAEKIRVAVNGMAEERFWVFSITALLVGAQISVELGLTKIDVRALAGHLCKDVFPKLRQCLQAEHEHIIDGKTDELGEMTSHISAFIKECVERSMYLATDRVPRPGPRKLNEPPVTVLVPDPGMPHRMITVDAHFIREDNILRIRQRALHDYMVKKQIYRRGFLNKLKTDLGAIATTTKLGTGTPFESPVNEPLLVFRMNQPRLKDILHDAS